MPPQKKTRKTRVSKKAVKRIREDANKSSYTRKKTIIPGPWTNVETDIEIKPKLKLNNSFYFKQGYYGSYTSDHNWNEKGWYPIIINVEAENLKDLVAEHGLDNTLAAAEKALNLLKDGKSKPLYGHVIFLSWLVDKSQEEQNRFISVTAKTNKKSIPGFIAIRKREMVLLGE